MSGFARLNSTDKHDFEAGAWSEFDVTLWWHTHVHVLEIIARHRFLGHSFPSGSILSLVDDDELFDGVCSAVRGNFRRKGP